MNLASGTRIGKVCGCMLVAIVVSLCTVVLARSYLINAEVRI
jgi:hypothetical protein